MRPEDFIRQVGVAFTEYVSRPEYIVLLAVFFAAVAFIVGSVLVRRARASMRRRHELMALFQRLSDVNELSTYEREMLLTAAKWHGLSNPSALFVRKSLLRRYIESAPVSGPRFDDLIRRAGVLMKKLYSTG